MSKVITSFKKGISGNPTGRPKGSINKLNKFRLEFELNAEKDSGAAYQELRTAMQAGESWAHSIFWKDVMPKKKDRQVVAIDFKNPDKLAHFLDSLKDFEEFTFEDVTTAIKTLSSVKLAEKIAQIEEFKTIEEKKYA